VGEEDGGQRARYDARLGQPQHGRASRVELQGDLAVPD
jgi:hypothetical protein